MSKSKPDPQPRRAKPINNWKVRPVRTLRVQLDRSKALPAEEADQLDVSKLPALRRDS